MINYLLYILFFSCIISTVLVILFMSDALAEYLRLFRINKLFKFLWVDSYFSQLKSSPMTVNNYWTFIGEKYYDYFVIRLITCPLCLSMYLAIILGLIFLNYKSIPIIYIGALIQYFTIRFFSK